MAEGVQANGRGADTQSSSNSRFHIEYVTKRAYNVWFYCPVMAGKHNNNDIHLCRVSMFLRTTIS